MAKAKSRPKIPARWLREAQGVVALGLAAYLAVASAPSEAPTWPIDAITTGASSDPVRNTSASACASPRAESGTSVWPCTRPSAFHAVSP
mgnify:CR=1 FL=1